MGVNVSKRCHLLIVRDDDKELAEYSECILQFSSEAFVSHKVRIERIWDMENKKRSIMCDKVLFLLNTKTNSFKNRVSGWLRSLPTFKESRNRRYMIIHVDETEPETNDGRIMKSETGDGMILKLMMISKIGNVFRWWPRLLKFMFPLPSVHAALIPNLKHVSLTPMFITNDGVANDQAETSTTNGLISFCKRQHAFIKLYLPGAYRRDEPDAKIIIINTSPNYSKSAFGESIRGQTSDTYVFLDREFDQDLLRGFNIKAFPPSRYLNAMFALMLDFQALGIDIALRIPEPPIGPLHARKERSSIIDNGISHYIQLSWRGYTTMNETDNSLHPAGPKGYSVTLRIERYSGENRKWTLVAQGVDVTMHRFEDRVDIDGSYKYRISCVNTWELASSPLESHYVQAAVVANF